jgi:hypothetical protein
VTTKFTHPQPICGSDWKSSTLERYNIAFDQFDTPSEAIGLQVTSTAEGERIIKQCKAIIIIEHEEKKKAIKFIPYNDIDKNEAGNHLSKLYSLLTGQLEANSLNRETVVDDLVCALLHHLGFNRGNTVVLRQNHLTLLMSKSRKEATPDVLVYDASSHCRLMIFEDKIADLSRMYYTGEPQLIAETIAAVQANVALEEAASKAQLVEAPSAQPRAVPAPQMWMVRVTGPVFTFYSAVLSPELLECVAQLDGMIKPPEAPTRIKRLRRLDFGIAEERAEIIHTLLAMRVTIQKE